MSIRQTDLILEHLKLGHCIDPFAALRLFGCNRLAARICDLRRTGVKITSKLIKVRTRSGQSRVSVYRLAA